MSSALPRVLFSSETLNEPRGIAARSQREKAVLTGLLCRGKSFSQLQCSLHSQLPA